MALTEIQPTLPPEGAFTDPELNFIDESPRGFFPENQDSNWGYRRKIFTDEIQVAFDQLNVIYSEIFPQTSQDYLDEWEEEVGLPQNPPNKTLQRRRSMVINRLRGGPFTRRQRREIVESYITATFGDPIILLPPGHPLVVAGSPLFNEPGDVSVLYSIIEYVTQFKYEVRILSGLSVDQVGLERDLRWYTPAGLQIVMDYGWTNKVGQDTGSAVDLVGTLAGSAKLMTVVDFGTGKDVYGVRGTDTGVGTDSGKRTVTGTDTNGATTENATAVPNFIQQDGGAGVESIGDRKLTQGDTGTGTDYAEFWRGLFEPPFGSSIPIQP